MADIELVIKMPKRDYNLACKYPDTLISIYAHYIKEGILLPKNHGRLIDADELKKEYPHDTDWDYSVNTNSYVVRSIDNSPTIVEADEPKRKKGTPLKENDNGYNCKNWIP